MNIARLAFWDAVLDCLELAYNPDQPRGADGKFGSGGTAAPRKKAKDIAQKLTPLQKQKFAAKLKNALAKAKGGVIKLKVPGSLHGIKTFTTNEAKEALDTLGGKVTTTEKVAALKETKTQIDKIQATLKEAGVQVPPQGKLPKPTNVMKQTATLIKFVPNQSEVIAKGPSNTFYKGKNGTIYKVPNKIAEKNGAPTPPPQIKSTSTYSPPDPIKATQTSSPKSSMPKPDDTIIKSSALASKAPEGSTQIAEGLFNTYHKSADGSIWKVPKDQASYEKWAKQEAEKNAKDAASAAGHQNFVAMDKAMVPGQYKNTEDALKSVGFKSSDHGVHTRPEVLQSHKNLTAAQRKAVGSFTGSSSDSIRASERSGNPSVQAQHLQAAVAAMPKQEMTVYRGMKFYGKEDYSHFIQEGGSFSFEATSSTSTSINTAANFAGHPGVIFKIKAKSAVSVKEISSVSYENELLVPHNAKFKITKVHPPVHKKSSMAYTNHLHLVEVEEI